MLRPTEPNCFISYPKQSRHGIQKDLSLYEMESQVVTHLLFCHSYCSYSGIPAIKAFAWDMLFISWPGFLALIVLQTNWSHSAFLFCMISWFHFFGAQPLFTPSYKLMDRFLGPLLIPLSTKGFLQIIARKLKSSYHYDLIDIGPVRKVIRRETRDEQGVKRRRSLYMCVFNITYTGPLVLLNLGQAATSCWTS